MAEQEKRKNVIKGLEICSAGEWNSTGGRDHTDCPYYPAGYTGCTCKLLMRDAFALLKAQEPVVPHRNYQYLSDYWCKCGWHLGKAWSVNYCSNCGRAVKWDG